MRNLIAVFVVSCFLAPACAVDGEATLEEWIDGGYRPRVVSAYEITGKRDGATTGAVATMILENGDRLRLEIEVAYNPVPVLRSGRWNLEGSRIDAGEVRAESVEFLGGQGEGASIGGRYRLNENDLPRFRVDLPLRTISQRGWTIE